MKQLTINHPAVWVAFVALTVLGFLWYGPLMGETWMGLVGLDMEKLEANPPGAGIWITNIIATIVPLYILAWLFTRLNVETALKGAMIGFLIGFGFVMLSDMTNNLFAMRPYELSWITGGFSTLSLTVGGLILGAWRKYTTA